MHGARRARGLSPHLAGPAFGSKHGPGVGILVMVGADQNKFKPSVKAVRELYYQSKGGEQ